jgi:ribosomal protein S18 acetylase RimI-like enzyme
MAALVEPAPYFPPLELCDLHAIRAQDLEALLAEESAFWWNNLAWDFSSSASLVRKFVEIHALSGSALLSAKKVVGYCYYVLEDQKGLIGDLYVLREYRTEESQLYLLNAVVREMTRAPFSHRIESQLMTFTANLPPGDPRLRIFPRNFLSLRLPLRAQLPPREFSSRLIVSPWQDHHQEAAAQLIAEAYLGHVDSQINDQYRSLAGARKFLYNIVQYPGCGNFFPRASLTAYDRESGALCAICLASLVAPESGHITQICVARAWQGHRLGYELLRQSLELFTSSGVDKVSLTVTSSNAHAKSLYLRMGFRTIHEFSAYVWDDF